MDKETIQIDKKDFDFILQILNSTVEKTERMTSGNFMHEKAGIAGLCLNEVYYLKKKYISIKKCIDCGVENDSVKDIPMGSGYQCYKCYKSELEFEEDYK